MTWESGVSWAIAVLALAAPLAIGGAHPTTQVVLSLATLLLVAAFALTAAPERSLRPVPFMWPALIAVGYTALQLVPLPAPLVAALSPSAHELRSETGGGALMPLTVDGPATALALARGFACFGLLLIVATHARSFRRARPIMMSLAALGALLATITLVQRMVGAHAILGFYVPRSMPGGGFFGTFVNGNHAASVLALSSLISAGLALDAKEGKRFLFVTCAVLSGAVVFYTASRAGAVGFAVGVLILTSVALVRRLGWATGMLTALALVAVASGATLWLADGLRSRLLPSAPDALYENQKLRGWHDTANMTLAYRWTGVGRGAFEAPASGFRQDDEAVRLVYPENIVLQSASEWGVPVTLLLIGLLGAGLFKLLPGLRGRELGVIGAAAGVVAVLVHELADFGSELLGVAFPLVVALAMVAGALERRKDSRSKEHVTPRIPMSVVTVGLLLWAMAVAGAAWAVPHTLDADFDRVTAAYKAKDPSLPSILAAAVARHPADDHLELVAAEDALRRHDPSALHHLNRALRLHPANWQAHYLAARTLLALGRQPQAAIELRLSIERGSPVGLDELLASLGKYVVDGVPQRSEDLLRLAHGLVLAHRLVEADEACVRAVAVASAPGPAMIERVQVAIQANDPRMLSASAQALLDSQPDEEAAVVAVRALAQSGDLKATDEALDLVLTLHPGSSMLTLLGAQLRFDRGDAAGARDLIKHAGEVGFSLADRQRAQELLAKIADKEGDVDGAMMARARARLLAHKISDAAVGP